MPTEQLEIVLEYSGPDIEDGAMAVEDLVPVLQGIAGAYGKVAASKGIATPRARFEAIAIGSYLALKERPQLALAPPDVTTWLDGEDFHKITTSDSANAIKKLNARIGFVRDHLLGVEAS